MTFFGQNFGLTKFQTLALDLSEAFRLNLRNEIGTGRLLNQPCFSGLKRLKFPYSRLL